MQELSRTERAIKTFDKYLTIFEKNVSAVLLLGVVISVLIGIVMRFLLRAPNMYGEEISRYLLIACVFIGVSIGVREKAHLGIDSIVNALPKKASNVVHFISDTITALVYMMLAVMSCRFALTVKSFGQKSPSMQFLPMYLVYSLLLLGFMLSSIRAVMMIWNDYFAVNKVLSETDQIPSEQ